MTGTISGSGRPLIISDCDEVLLKMVAPFAAWVEEAHDVAFQLENTSFANALRHRSTGAVLKDTEVWPLLDGFFTSEMHRQQPIDGAIAAMLRLSQWADIVILTNVGPDHQAARIAQLAGHGLDDRTVREVIGSRGGKGEPVAELVARYQPSVAIFIDDLPQHHKSVADHAPDVWRLHMVGEPDIADKIRLSEHAHARIDDWQRAEPWIAARIDAGERPAVPQTVFATTG
ncbi:MAG: DUF2608 domain-containing protein [Sphingopyxis sp.]|nr:DUF2608 domain-containing protein [Sphingopyxis sp.]